jgi:diaminopimelate epimerase
MKTVQFKKYNATGNDFIIIDNREHIVDASDKKLWESMCRLKTGIGADGVLLVEKSTNYDFKMRYINADGGEVSMCGNGGRAITAFVHADLMFNKSAYQFETMNSVYESFPDKEFGYRLKMTELYDQDKIQVGDLVSNIHAFYLNTGVPHAVFEVDQIDQFDVFNSGKKVRYDQRFEKGTNANFYQVIESGVVKIRTYERGVENETLSCGTGAVATALTAARFHHFTEQVIMQTMGGILAVKFSNDFKEIYLCGKVEKVFDGSFQIN